MSIQRIKQALKEINPQTKEMMITSALLVFSLLYLA